MGFIFIYNPSFCLVLSHNSLRVRLAVLRRRLTVCGQLSTYKPVNVSSFCAGALYGGLQQGQLSPAHRFLVSLCAAVTHHVLGSRGSTATTAATYSLLLTVLRPAVIPHFIQIISKFIHKNCRMEDYLSNVSTGTIRTKYKPFGWVFIYLITFGISYIFYIT